MAENFENLDNILHDWEKDKNKKSIAEAFGRYEKHILEGKRKIKFNFSQSQEILDTLIDVRNAKHENTTS